MSKIGKPPPVPTNLGLPPPPSKPPKDASSPPSIPPPTYEESRSHPSGPPPTYEESRSHPSGPPDVFTDSPLPSIAPPAYDEATKLPSLAPVDGELDRTTLQESNRQIPGSGRACTCSSNLADSSTRPIQRRVRLGRSQSRLNRYGAA